MENTVIVCYMGGTAGDLISLMLDPTELSNERMRLKKPHLFSDDSEKDNFLVTAQWRSLPSHDFEYHRRRSHPLLGIVCRDSRSAIWAATRFKSLHRPHVWEEMSKFCGADDINGYAKAILDFGSMLNQYPRGSILYLDRILTGHACEDLSALGFHVVGNDVYQKWLAVNAVDFNTAD